MPIRKQSRKLSGGRSGRKLSGRKVRVGPRGGKYVLRAGKKVYLSGGGLACSHRRKKKDPKCEDQAGCKWEKGRKPGCFDPTAAAAAAKKKKKKPAEKKKPAAAAKKKKPVEKGGWVQKPGYKAVVRSYEGKLVLFEIYKTLLVTAKPGYEYEMPSFGYWQRVCIYGQKYIIKNKKWEDFQIPMRGEHDEYFQDSQHRYVESVKTEEEAIKYLQDQMKEVLKHFKDPQKAPTIVTDDEKYILRQWYPFTL